MATPILWPLTLRVVVLDIAVHCLVLIMTVRGPDLTINPSFGTALKACRGFKLLEKPRSPFEAIGNRFKRSVSCELDCCLIVAREMSFSRG
jgi:hypothetical protein